MDPQILEFLKKLLETQGSSFGIPTTAIPNISTAITGLQGLQTQQNQSRRFGLNTDPLRDIEPYRVNPNRGYLAQLGGMIQGSGLGMLPFILPGEGLLPLGQQMQAGGPVYGYSVSDYNPNSRRSEDKQTRQELLYNMLIESGIDIADIKGESAEVKLAFVEALDKIIKDNGNPDVKRYKGRANYNSLTNTVNIPSARVLLDEVAHAKQAKDEGALPMTMRAALDIIKTMKPDEHVKSLGLPFVLPNQLKTYNTLGTLENEAHRKIKPELDKRLVNELDKIFSSMDEKQQGGYINTTGYTPGTPSFNNPFNVIPSNNITMQNTPFPIIAIPNNGQPQILQPGMNKKFNGANSVLEFPLMQLDGFTQMYDPNQLMAMMGLGVMNPEQYDRGGRIARRQARLLRRQVRLESRGKGDSKRADNIQDRLDDIATGGSGLSGFGRGLESVGNVAGKLAKVVGPILAMTGVGLPIGAAIGAAGNLMDKAITTDAERGLGNRNDRINGMGTAGTNPTPFQVVPPAQQAVTQGYKPWTGGSLFDLINPQQNSMLPPNPVNFNNPLSVNTGTYPPPTGNTGIGGLLPILQNMGFGKCGGRVKRYQVGGEVQGINLIPIQTEKVGKIPEMIVHLDKTITTVNATKPHSKMDENEVTDIVPEGSYIASADKNMRITWEEADEVTIGVKAQPYDELEQGVPPKEIKLSSLWPKGSKKPLTPAELMQLLKDEYPTMDKDSIFTKITNQSNINSREPYINAIITLSESKKTDPLSGPAGTFKKGGKVEKYQEGDWVNQVAGLATTLGPLIGQIFGGGGNNTSGTQAIGQLPPWLQTAMLSTIPTYQMGVTQNIGSQSNALNQAITDFSSLGTKLIGDANQSAQGQQLANLGAAGIGAFNALGTETTLPRLDLGAARARVSNYSPVAATRASIDAAATPTYDSREILRSLGARSGPLLAQLESQRLSGINAAANQRNQIIDQSNLNKINSLNQIDMTELPFNIQQQEKERQLREGRRNLLSGTLSQGIQRGADINTGLLGQIGNIQSQILPITTQYALQNAGLAGQDLMLGSQNAFNGYNILGGLLSQNALAQFMGQNNPMQQQTGAGGANNWMSDPNLGAILGGILGGGSANTGINGGSTTPGYVPPSGAPPVGGCPPGTCLYPDGTCQPC